MTPGCRSRIFPKNSTVMLGGRAEVYSNGFFEVLEPDPEDGGWAGGSNNIATGNVDAIDTPDVLISANVTSCGGRADLFLNYGDPISFNAPNSPEGDEITWGTNQFGYSQAIVDNYIFISAMGDQRPGDLPKEDHWNDGLLFRAGRVFVYKVN